MSADQNSQIPIARGARIQEYTDALRKGVLNKSGIVRTVRENIEQASPLNAFLRTFSEQEALQLTGSHSHENEEKRVLDGVPFSLKDCFDVPGYPTTAATKSLADHVVDADKEYTAFIKRLLTAGAVPVGKNNMHELGCGTSGINTHAGAVKNPHNISFIAGGSSSGTGAIVGSGVLPFGVGADTQGSGRISAVFCGSHGFCPTPGRYGSSSKMSVATNGTPTLLCRSISDISLIDSVMAGEKEYARTDPTPPAHCKVGVPNRHFWGNLEDEVKLITTRLLGKMRNRGIGIQPIEFPEEIITLNKSISTDITMYEFFQSLQEYIRNHQLDDKLTIKDIVASVETPAVKELLTQYLNNPVSEERYNKIINEERPRLLKLFHDTLEEHGVDTIIMPTAPVPPSRLQEGETVTVNGEEVPLFSTHIRNCELSSTLGCPSLAMCAGKTKTNGVPVGLSVDGKPGQDRELLGIGCILEKIIPTLPLPEISAGTAE